MLKEFLYLVFCGFFLGLSVFAPGFSGSVIAIILGIYHEIIRITSNPFKDFKKNVMYCLPLGIGALISAVLFVLAFDIMFERYEKATYLLFVGLIAGNLPIIFADVRKYGLKISSFLWGTMAFAAAFILSIVAVGAENVGESGLLILAIAGLLAGATALIPGMSVSMVLIIMGVYGQLISIASGLLHGDFSMLLPFAIFCVTAVIGLVFTARGIKATFARFPAVANTAVLGFMSGSLIGIFLKSIQMPSINFNWGLGAGALAAGLVVSMLFVVLGKKMKKSES
ncbi:MAG: DUF368 domain-containing protein [Oscillospiraceae bacterium]|nr:DUF368 domain-containing protein [Oscillospiraceae bacterium]